MARDSQKTKQKILASVGRLLARQSFGSLGINAVAREAGIDKVLIYRYFGGMPELLRAFAEQGDFWPSSEDLLDPADEAPTSLAEAGAALLTGHLRELRKRPITQEIMRWELIERNELTDELARYREQQGIEILKRLDLETAPTEKTDLPAAAALIHAGITYLILRAKTADVYLGVDLTTDEGWLRLAKAVQKLSTLMLENAPLSTQESTDD